MPCRTIVFLEANVLGATNITSYFAKLKETAGKAMSVALLSNSLMVDVVSPDWTTSVGRNDCDTTGAGVQQMVRMLPASLSSVANALCRSAYYCCLSPMHHAVGYSLPLCCFCAP